MSGIKFVFFIGLLSLCDAFWWGRENRDPAPLQAIPSSTIPPALRQYPISYIRAFAYHPVAFPQPLAPITTYHVRNQQSPSRSFPIPGSPSSLLQQQPSNPQFAQESTTTTAAPTTTTSTTTTTPQPTTTTTTTQVPQFSGSQPVPQAFSRIDYGQFSRSDYGQSVQRQLPQQSTNYGGYPYYYNQQYQYRYDDGSSNQFSGRLYNDQQQFQQYNVDPVTYQFIPTSITPITQQNSIKFVPCMCPVSVQVSPNLVEKRTDDIPIVSATTESTSTTPVAPVQSSSSLEEIEEEAK